MATLVRNGGCVLINGVPFQRGELDVIPEDYAASKLSVYVRRNGPSNPIVQRLTYVDITLDGEAATNWNEVDTWVQSNFFFDVTGGGGGGEGDTVMRRIVADVDDAANGYITLPDLPVTWTMFYHAENNLINGGSWNHVLTIEDNQLTVPGLTAGNVIIVFGH